VEKGVYQAMARGILAGHPVVDVRVTIDDGSFHPVDSSEAAFIMAGILGFQAAAKNAAPVLLEPILEVEIAVPDAMTGDLMGDINGRRGHIVGIEPSLKNGYQTIRAQIPQAEMQRYAVDLRSLARGRASFKATPAHYAEVPAHIAQPLIADYEKRKAEGHASGHE
jgi:elongation factor G